MSSTTLARRIRRIGILPTTYKTVEEQRLAKDENGKEVSLSVEIKKPIHNHEKLDLGVLKLRREALISAARAARQQRQQKRQTEQQRAREWWRVEREAKQQRRVQKGLK